MNLRLKNKKGQVMVLDVVFAIILIILIFFLLFRWTEIKTYQSIDDRQKTELNYISKTAFISLTENHSINCYAFDNDNYYLISSCFGEDSVISKNNLGIPINYKCNFAIDGFSITTNDCNDAFVPSTTSNYFSIDFNVTTNTNRQLNKISYLANILDKSSTLDEHEATLVIWK